MLVLARKPGETIVIKNKDMEVELQVLGYKGSQVRLGFVANRDISILRKELIKIQGE